MGRSCFLNDCSTCCWVFWPCMAFVLFVTSLGLCVQYVYLVEKSNSVKTSCNVTYCGVEPISCTRCIGTTDSRRCYVTTCWNSEVTLVTEINGTDYYGVSKISHYSRYEAEQTCQEDYYVGKEVTCYYSLLDDELEPSLSRSSTMVGGIASVTVFTILAVSACSLACFCCSMDCLFSCGEEPTSLGLWYKESKEEWKQRKTNKETEKKAEEVKRENHNQETVDLPDLEGQVDMCH